MPRPYFLHLHRVRDGQRGLPILQDFADRGHLQTERFTLFIGRAVDLFGDRAQGKEQIFGGFFAVGRSLAVRHLFGVELAHPRDARRLAPCAEKFFFVEVLLRCRFR